VNQFKTQDIPKGELTQHRRSISSSLLFERHEPRQPKGLLVKSADGKSFRHRFGSANSESETSWSQGRLYVTLLEPDTPLTGRRLKRRGGAEGPATTSLGTGMVGKMRDVNHDLKPIPGLLRGGKLHLKAADPQQIPGHELWCLGTGAEVRRPGLRAVAEG
jgi:hypothetical protein